MTVKRDFEKWGDQGGLSALRVVTPKYFSLTEKQLRMH